MSQFQIVVSVVVLAWLATFGVIQAMHAYFRHLDFRIRYFLGTAALCGGCTATGFALDNALLAIVPWLLASACATIIINYAAEERREREKRAARKEGEIVAMTRGLTQEIIDNGGRHDARESRIHDPSRRN